MTQIIASRRSFLVGLGALIAAPAIVRVGSLMPVKQIPSVEDLGDLLRQRMNDAYKVMADNLNSGLYGDEFHRIRFNDGIFEAIPVKWTEVFKGRLN